MRPQIKNRISIGTYRPSRGFEYSKCFIVNNISEEEIFKFFWKDPSFLEGIEETTSTIIEEIPETLHDKHLNEDVRSIEFTISDEEGNPENVNEETLDYIVQTIYDSMKSRFVLGEIYKEYY